MRPKLKWILTLLVVFTIQFSFAQEKTIKGIVSDASGVLPGANVIIKGTQTGVSTGFDGSYSIKAKEGESLVYSFMGMSDAVKVVGASNIISVVLKDNAKQLGEVVVQGAVGTKKKKDQVTSAFTVISAKEMGVAANPNAARSLTGKVAGLQINNISNGVNGNTSIKIRTAKSFSTNGEALIIIDGVPSSASNFASMTSSMIENVNVIKGAQGSALYGSQGVNGVIVVTTKKGLSGDKVSVDFNSSLDFESISFVPERQLKYGQGWDGAWDQFENGGWGELFDGSIRPVGLKQPDGTYLEAPYSPIKDNLKQFYNDGSIVQNGIGIRVGSDNGYVNFNADNQLRDFIVKGDNFRRSNFLLKTGMNKGKWSIDGQFNYRVARTSQSDSNTTLEELEQGAANIPIGLFNNGSPYGWTKYYNNPFWRRDNNRIGQDVNFFNTVANLGYKINKNIGLKYNAGIRSSNTNQVNTRNKLVENKLFEPNLGGYLGQTSAFYQTNTNDRRFYGDLMLDFDYDLSDKVSFKALLGHNMTKEDSNTVSQGGTRLDVEGWYNIQNVTSLDVLSQLNNFRSKYNTTAEFASVDLGYKDYLFLNLTGRYEHVSQLLPANRDFFYPSAGVSFIPTKIDGLSGNKISYLKLYANYTNVGSTEAVPNYRVLDYGVLGGGFPYNGTISYSDLFSRIDANITPEFYKTTEAGFVLGMFNDRVTIDAAAYITNTTDAISNVTTSTASGFSSSLSNIGNITTKGLEVSLGLTPIKTDNFNWNMNFNFSTYKNKVTSLGGQDSVTLYDLSNASGIEGAIVASVGQPFPMLQGTDWVRDAQGRVVIDDVTGLPVTEALQKNLGKVNPDYILGYSNNISYKGFGLAWTMDYRKGGKLFSETIYNMTWSGHLVNTADHDRDLGFIYPNSVLLSDGSPNTTVYTAGGYDSTRGEIAYAGLLASLGAHNVVDATALKVREVSLSYTLNAKNTKSLGLSNLKFSLNARNPFILLADNNKGYTDPEASSLYDGATTNASRRTNAAVNTNGAAAGFSPVSQYPSTKTFGFAVNVGF